MRFNYPIINIVFVLSVTLQTASAANVIQVSNNVTSNSAKKVSQSDSSPRNLNSANSSSNEKQADVLLFAGNGTWSDDVSSLENILGSHSTSYDEISSDELNSMSLDQLSKYKLILFPGGNGATETDSLTESTHANLRAAIQQNGVSYFGICAGAFIAVAPAPEKDKDVSYGVGVVNGDELDYYHLENAGTDIAMTLQSFADGSKADILWYGGPMTPNIPGGVVAKYPDGTPSISEMKSGNGFVILSGGHPTATEATLQSLGMNSSDGTHLDLTWKLIDSAIHKQPLPAFS